MNRYIALRPNPARNNIELALSLESGGIIQIGIFDLLGRSVTNAHCNSYSAGKATVPLQLPALPDGYYFIRVKADGHVGTLPLEIRKR